MDVGAGEERRRKRGDTGEEKLTLRRIKRIFRSV